MLNEPSPFRALITAQYPSDPLSVEFTSTFQCGLPLVIPSSGSIANNGALTLTTAVPLSGGYSWGCYMYFPAAAIHAASTAGWYFVIMTSNVLGTIYNNQLVANTVPAVPTTLVPFVTTGPGAYAQSTGVIDMLTLTIPGNTLGRNGRMQVEPSWLMPNNANNKTVSVTFGGSNWYGKTRTTVTQECPLLDLRNRGVTNKQISTWSGAGLPNPASTSGVNEMNIDTTADVPLLVRGQLAVATDYIILSGFSILIGPFQ